MQIIEPVYVIELSESEVILLKTHIGYTWPNDDFRVLQKKLLCGIDEALRVPKT